MQDERTRYKRHCEEAWTERLGRRRKGRRQAQSGVSKPCVKATRSEAVSVILVQGLNAHPYYTWAGRQTPLKGRSDSSLPRPWYKKFGGSRASLAKETGDALQAEIFWPRDLLSQHLEPARIATYSYLSDWRSSQFKTDVRECGEQLLNVLCQQRSNEASKGSPTDEVAC